MGQKVWLEIWPDFFTLLNFESPAFENAARYLNSWNTIVKILSHTLPDCREILHYNAAQDYMYSDCRVVKIHFRSKPKLPTAPHFVRIRIRISTPLALSRLRFETRRDIWNLKRPCWAQMIAPGFLQVWWSWVYAPLRIVRRECSTL